MTKRKRKVFLITGGGLVVLAILVLLFGAKGLKSRVVATASKALGMDVQVRGGVGVSLFPALGASIADIVVANGGSEVATVAKAKVGLKLLPLITGKVRISRIELVKPAISIVRLKNGKLNIETPKGKSSGIPVSLQKLAVSQGSLHFTNLESGGGMVLEGLDITARDLFAGGTPGGGPMKTLSFVSDVRCHTIKAGGVVIADLVLQVEGKKGVVDVSKARMTVFGGPGNGTLHADFTGDKPRYKMLFAVKQLKVEQLLQESPNSKNMSGLADLSADLTASGKTIVEMKRTLRGQASLNGENIALNGMDIDDLISSLIRSQRFSLVDVGAFFLAGPLGPVLNRGYRFADLFQDSQGGRGVIAKLVSVWKVDKGVAEAVDVAMATKKRRIAMKGGLNFNDNRFEDVVVAVVDQHGCALLTQKVRGPFGRPEMGNVNVLKSLTSPVTSLLRSVGKLFSNKPCEVFYAGSVAAPEDGKRP
ncbi:MAG: AsmA family protein [Candidatus Aminicenantales bacterium]